MLVRVNRGKCTNVDSVSVDVESQDVLKALYGRYWLKCNCNPTDAAILTIRKLANGNYTLMNISGRGEHELSCEHHYNKSVHESERNNSSNFRFPRKRHKHEDSKHSYTSGSGTNEPVLNRLLELLITNSGFLTIQPERNFKENIEVLNVDGASSLTVNKDPLTDRISYGFDKFSSIREKLAIEFSSGKNRSPWFIFDIVDEVEFQDGCFHTTKYYSNKISKNFKFFKSYTEVIADITVKGPYMVFAVIDDGSETTDSQKIVPTRAIIQPIANKHQWLPVFNDLERFTVIKLENAQSWYRNNVGLDISVKRLHHRKNFSSYTCTSGNNALILSIGEIERCELSIKADLAINIQEGMFREKIDDLLFSGISSLFKQLKSAV